MVTYADIQEWVKQHYGFIPKTCWIAHGKELDDISVDPAWNRR